MFRSVAILWALTFPLAVWAADPPPELLKVPPRPLDSLKLPPGTIIIVASDPKDPLQKIDAVFISPEEFRRLLDAADQLKKQSNPDKPEPPSVCRLSGKVETRGLTERIILRAAFEFITASPKAVVALGGRKAAAISATLDDGKLPPLQFGDDGYSVAVDAAGPHKLTMEFEVPLQSRGAKGGERGFLFHLPACPITLLERLELPAGITTARLRGIPAGAADPPQPRTLPVKDLFAAEPGKAAVALGSIEALELFWDVAAPAKPADPLLVGGGDLDVRIDETTVTTTAKLVFRSLTGRVMDWKLLAPAGSDVTADPMTGGEPIVSQTDDKSTWIIRTKEPGVEEIRVTVQTRTPRKPGGVTIGPYQLVGAFRQQGVVRVTAPSQLRPRFSKLRPDVTRRAPDADGELAFAFGVGPNPAVAAWLSVDAEPVRGEVRTQVSHSLTLTDSGWRLACDIKATPVRTELERLDVELPLGLQDVQCSPPELVETIAQRRDLGPTRWQIRLAHPRTSDVTIRIEGFYPIAAGVREAALLLPRAVQTFDRDGRVTVTVPDGWEARGGVAEWQRDKTAEWGRPLETGMVPHTISLTADRTPARVDLTWGRVIPELTVRATIDLTLDNQTAIVRHRLVFPASPVARSVPLRAAPATILQIRAVEGDFKPAVNGGWVLDLPPSPSQDQSVVLSYTCKLAPKPNDTVEPALVWPSSATRCDTRMRIWSKAASKVVRPLLADGLWEELPIEAVPDRSLPALVLHGTGVELPLALHLTEVGISLQSIVQRAFVLVDIESTGIQSYTAHFQLQQVQGAEFEFELPAELLNLKAFVGGIAADPLKVEIDASKKLVRVPARNWSEGRPVTLSYQLPPIPGAGTAASLWRWRFTPPRLLGAYVGEVRWFVTPARDGVLLSWDSTTQLQQQWGWRLGRILPEQKPDRTRASLEEWFRTGRDPEPLEPPDESSPNYGQPVSATGAGPMQLMAIPHVLWVAVCSLTVLALGGFLAALRRRPALVWSGLALLTLTAGALIVFRPQPALAAVPAGIPGAVVLIVALTISALLRRQHRRRIVRMPGFARSQPAAPSSVTGSSERRRLQPSTVDAPEEAV